jgi:glutamine synthetase
MKFEFRAVGSSQSIAFPVMLLNAAVAEAVEDLTEKLRAELESTKSVDDAVLKVVRASFAASGAVRFEGNNYSAEWVTEAERRGLKNLRRTPEALAELVTDQSRALLTSLGILNEVELESRYHVRLERYVKDMLIEMHTMRELVDTMVLPAGYAHVASLVAAASQGNAAGVNVAPLAKAANDASALVGRLQSARETLDAAIAKAEGMHDDLAGQARFLTSQGADAMAGARSASDALELTVADDRWPLPKYREMLFPV